MLRSLWPLSYAKRNSVGGGGPTAFTNGALIARTSSYAPNTSAEDVSFNDGGADIRDPYNLHDPGSNPARITVTDTALIRLTTNVSVSYVSNQHQFEHRKNGASFVGRGGITVKDLDNAGDDNFVSAIVSVVNGDYFTLYKNDTNGDSIAATFTWQAIEVLPSSIKYALVRKTSAQTIPGGTFTTLTWDSTPVAEVDEWFDGGTDNTLLSVPAGVSRARVSMHITSTAASGTLQLLTVKSDLSTPQGMAYKAYGAESVAKRLTAMSAIIPRTSVAAYKIRTASSGGAYDVGTDSWVCIEEVPATIQAVLCKRSANQSPVGGTWTAVAWDQEDYDDASLHSTVTNNSRFVVPSGVTRVRLVSNLRSDAGGLEPTFRAAIFKNGDTAGGPGLPIAAGDHGGADYANMVSDWFYVGVNISVGDYLEVYFQGDNLASSAFTWACFEVE